jgi:hypothetical protein
VGAEGVVLGRRDSMYRLYALAFAVVVAPSKETKNVKCDDLAFSSGRKKDAGKG